MKNFIAILIIAISLASCDPGVQGNGNVKSQSRNVESFDAIDISGGYEIHIAQTGESSLRIEADENLHQYIETYVENGTLYVSSERRIGRSKELDLYLTVDQLRAIESSGATEVTTRGVVKGDQLSLDFSGAVEAELELNYERLRGDFSGAAELNLSGKADEVSIDASGAVEVNALDLETRRFSLDISGAGEFEVFVTEELNVEASGAVEVNYKGNPENVNRKVSGAASIEPI
jgi:hypothetical protein